jgi:hypothetical protein
MNLASVYTFFPPLFSGLTTNFVNPGYPNVDQMKGKGFPIFLNKTVYEIPKQKARPLRE